MESPYIIALNKFKIASDHEFNCSPNIGIDQFKRATFIGSSASGMSFGVGRVNGVDVFVKQFVKPCHFNLIKTRTHRKSIVDDMNELEIGITSLLSSLLTPVTDKIFTQNLIFLYGYRQCQYAFEGDTSACTGMIIPPQKQFMISRSLCNQPNAMDKYPQCRYISQYYDSDGRGTNRINDTVNYMVVEMANGDLEDLLDQQIG